MASTKHEEANRHHGGPGSSHQRPDLPDPTIEEQPLSIEPTHFQKSKVSGGGGERDSHHTREPVLKGGRE